MDRRELREALETVDKDLAQTIETIKESHTLPYHMKSIDGRYILADALVERARVLTALAHLTPGVTIINEGRR